MLNQQISVVNKSLHVCLRILALKQSHALSRKMANRSSALCIFLFLVRINNLSSPTIPRSHVAKTQH